MLPVVVLLLRVLLSRDFLLLAIGWSPLLDHVHRSSRLRVLLYDDVYPWMERWRRGCPYSLSSGCWWCFLPHLLVCLLELLEVPAFVQLVAGFLHAVSIIETVYCAWST